MSAPIPPEDDLTPEEKRLAKVYDDLVARGTSHEDALGTVRRQYAHATGELGRTMRSRNREDLNAVDRAIADFPSYPEQVNRRVLALTDFVPGAHSLIAAGRAATDPNTDIDEAVAETRASMDAYNADDTETWRRRGLKLAGGGAAGGAVATRLPALSVAKQAGLLGAAGGAGTLDADMSAGERAGATAVGGVTGLAAGKLLDVAITGAMGMAAPRPVADLLEQQAERARVAAQMYGAAEREGISNLGRTTHLVDDFINEPDIAAIVADLQATRQYRGLPGRHPRMLDAIYKELSDRAGMLKKGEMAPNPSRPNVGRVRQADVADAQAQALDAISEPRGPMPSYADAVREFARRSRLMDAYKRGYEALRSESAVGLPPLNSLTKRAPEALEEWLSRQPAALQAELRAAAGRGVTGATKEATRRISPIRPFWSLAPMESVADASAVMRTAGLPKTKGRGLLDVMGSTTAGSAGQGAGQSLLR